MSEAETTMPTAEAARAKKAPDEHVPRLVVSSDVVGESPLDRIADVVNRLVGSMWLFSKAGRPLTEFQDAVALRNAPCAWIRTPTVAKMAMPAASQGHRVTLLNVGVHLPPTVRTMH